MVGGLGPLELSILLLLFFVLFGAQRLPELAKRSAVPKANSKRAFPRPQPSAIPLEPLPISKPVDGRPIKCSWTVQKPLASTLQGCPLKSWKRKSLPLKPSTTRASESTSAALDLQ